MGNRIIKESIKYSPEIDRLNWFEEVVFYHMMVSADDYGRLDGRPVVLAHVLFPMKENMVADVQEAVNALVEAGLVTAYEVDGMPFLCLTTWADHQRLRNGKPKYPAPPQVAASCGELPQAAANESKAPQNAARACAGARAQNPNPNPNPNPNSARARAYACAGNPFGDDDGERPDLNTVEVYVANNIPGMNAANMDEMASFKADLPDDVIRYAVDVACGKNVRTWAYVRGILNRILAGPARTLAEVKDWDAKHASQQGAPKGQPAPNPALNYEQRSYDSTDPDEFNLDMEYFLETGESRTMAERKRALAKEGVT